MTTNKCECLKSPCTCKTGRCNFRKSTDSAKIENIDENGNVHYVESIYQKISLDIFENSECCVPQPNDPSNKDDSNAKAENEESVDCVDCCEDIYVTSLPEEKHDCPNECNITAELYCQIKRHNAEPGETFSDCSSFSSSDDDDSEESDDENIGDDNDDNSEATFEEEDSKLIEEADNRIYCQNKNCCSLNSQEKCKYNISGDSNAQNKQKPNENDEENTIPPKSPRHKRKNKKPKEAADEDYNTEFLQFYDQNLPSKNQTDEPSWIVPERQIEETRSADIEEMPREYKRLISISKGMKDDIFSEIQTIAKDRKRKLESLSNAVPNAAVRFGGNSTDPDNDFFSNRQERQSIASKRRRVTVSNFVSEEELKVNKVVPDTRLLNKPFDKPEHRDAFYLLDKSKSKNKLLWKSYVPYERSDFSLLPVESFTKKIKKSAKTEKVAKPAHTMKREPRQSFIRKAVEPFKPTKFLCFKYVPKIPQKKSSTSIMQDNLIDIIAIDPPDDYLTARNLFSQTKFQGSRIPVARPKKVVKKRSFDFDIPRRPRATRTLTLGLDEIRNVLEERCKGYRRSTISPENRKSFMRKSVMKKSFAADGPIFGASTSRKSTDDEAISSSQFKKQGKQVVLFGNNDDGSGTSLQSKLDRFNSTPKTRPPLAASAPKKKGPKKETKTEKKVKVPLAADNNNNGGMQKTCCSQTGIHVCVKESVISKKGEEQSNIIQIVNIDVTPKNSNLVKVNVMPTVPEIDKEGIITIPVQLKLCNASCNKEPKKPVKMCPARLEREKLLYQENLQNSSYNNNIEDRVDKEDREDRKDKEDRKDREDREDKEDREDREDRKDREDRENISPQNLQEEPYVNVLWTKMQNTLSETQKEEIKTESVEIQTDLALGKKLLSASLNSLTYIESTTSAQKKPVTVQRSNIDWDNIVLPPPGTLVIKQMPTRKKRRISQEGSQTKDNNIPSTSESLPQLEEIKTIIEPSESINTENKPNSCCTIGKSNEEPYRPANSSAEKATKEELPPLDKDTKCTRSKIISLVFSESFYDIDNSSSMLDETLVDEEKLIAPCTTKPEIPWTNILLPTKPQIRKIEKPNISKTNSCITDQTFTHECNSMSPSSKTTDTNITNFHDKETNTSSVKEDCQAAPSSGNMCTNSMAIMKTFKEDPVLSAFKAFEEELKPVRKALAEVQCKLKALNIPELECLFKKDPISDYVLSSSNSQIAQNWEYRQPAAPYMCKLLSDSLNPSHCLGQRPSEQFERHRRFPYNDLRVYRFATPPIRARSKNLSTNIWKSYGSCDRHTIHEKIWKPPDFHNMRNADSCNYPPYSSARYASRYSTPESNFHYVPIESSGIERYNEQKNCPYFRNMLDRKIEMINDYDDLDYPSTYRNTPTHSHINAQQESYCDSEHSLYSDTTEISNSNHALANLQPKYSSSFHTPTAKYNIPVKVRPVTYCSLPDDKDLQNTKYIPTRNTSIDLKKDNVQARTKIELPRAASKRVNNMQKSVWKTDPQPYEKNYYSKSASDGFSNKRHPYNCSCEYSSMDGNLPLFSNRYKEYSKKERYA